MEKEKPIYKFSKSKNVLKELGYQVEKAEAYRPIKPVDVSIKNIKDGTIEITDDGIFFKTSDGQKHKGFMYKREYHLARYGKPRFHTRNCRTIQEFKARGSFTAEYRWSNDDKVLVCDMDDNFIDKTVDILPLCKYCAEIQRNEQSDIYKDSEEFVNELKKAIPQETVTNVDVLGYTKEWQDISKHYREKHKYTCERCGIHITNTFDYGYIHCHHRNGNKTDNRDENLECLCIECHSNVDKSHEIRFSKGANVICLQDFIKKYRGNKTL
jgi:HNH endonuclease